MTLATYTQPEWNGLKVVTERLEEQQRDRILAVLGMSGDRLPAVDDETLHQYYKFLSEALSFPFTAHYWKQRRPGYASTPIGRSEVSPVSVTGVFSSFGAGYRASSTNSLPKRQWQILPV